MNISTYEARIAALEAQMGPVPGPETGLVSVVLNPDITLLDGTTLNAKLAEMMPMEFGDSETLRPIVQAGTINVGDTFSVTVTPDDNSIALIQVTDGESVHGEIGAALTTNITVHGSAEVTPSIGFNAVAVENFPPEESDGSCSIRVRVG